MRYIKLKSASEVLHALRKATPKYARVKRKAADKRQEKIEFPENISRLAETLIEEKLREEREFTDKIKAAKIKQEKIEKENIKSGIFYAKKIWSWARKFVRADIGRKLIKVSHTPTAYKWVCFFDGHIEGLSWRGLGITDEGVCWMRSGCGATPQLFNSLRDLAKMDTKILRLACEWIDNGKVWECIERRFDYLKPEVRADRIEKMKERLLEK